MVGATVRVRGYSARPQVFPVSGDNSAGELAKTVTFKLDVAQGKHSHTDVTAEKFGGISRIDLELVEYADGSVWRANSERSCSVEPSLFMLVAESSALATTCCRYKKGPARWPGLSIVTRILSEDLSDRLVDGVLGDVADDLFGDLSALEEEKRGNSADAVAHGGRGVGVNVHLHDLELALVVAGHFIDDGSERATRAAPSCPEINKNRLLRLKDILLKICVVYFGYELSCHVLPSENALRLPPSLAEQSPQ